MNSPPDQNDSGALTRMGMALSDWAERWFPDALVFAMLAIVVVFVAGLSVRSTVSDLVTDFGDGFGRATATAAIVARKSATKRMIAR